MHTDFVRSVEYYDQTNGPDLWLKCYVLKLLVINVDGLFRFNSMSVLNWNAPTLCCSSSNSSLYTLRLMGVGQYFAHSLKCVYVNIDLIRILTNHVSDFPFNLCMSS